MRYFFLTQRIHRERRGTQRKKGNNFLPLRSSVPSAYPLYSKKIALYLILTLFSALLPVRGYAQEQATQGELQNRLRNVHEKIDREEKTLKLIKNKKEQINHSLEYLASETARLTKEKGELLQEQKILEKQMGELTNQVVATSVEVSTVEAQIRKRLISIYKLRRRAGGINYLLQATSATDLLRRATYLKIIARADQEQLNLLLDLVSRFEKEKNALKQTNDTHRQYLEQAAHLQAEYETKLMAQKDLLRKLKIEEGRSESTIKKLEEMADKLETLLAKMMGGAERELRPEKPQSGEVPPFVGNGLARLKGTLRLPVEGTLVRRFGKQRHEEFVDMLFIKGLEFHTAPGVKVQTVAPGKVIFSNILPGYGNVVIVDHGERYYTLYGRLASSIVSSGKIVGERETVGILGEADSKGRNFYFELRVKGKPEDPISYFKKQPEVVDIGGEGKRRSS